MLFNFLLIKEAKKKYQRFQNNINQHNSFNIDNKSLY